MVRLSRPGQINLSISVLCAKFLLGNFNKTKRGGITGEVIIIFFNLSNLSNLRNLSLPSYPSAARVTL